MTNRQLLNGSFARLQWFMTHYSRNKGQFDQATWDKLFELRARIIETVGKQALESEFWKVKAK